MQSVATSKLSPQTTPPQQSLTLMTLMLMLCWIATAQTGFNGIATHHQAFTYTANGDISIVTNGGKYQTFTYDSRNRNSAFDMRSKRSVARAKYTYNALGERVSKNGGGERGTRTHFIYDEQGHLIAEANDGRITKEYVYINGLPIAELDGNDIHYIHTDQLGTPQKMTDARQKIVWDRVSEPFGETLDIKGQATLNLRFPGQYHDAESDLDYSFFRSYNPVIGRYIQSDPIGLLGRLNTYRTLNSREMLK